MAGMTRLLPPGAATRPVLTSLSLLACSTCHWMASAGGDEPGATTVPATHSLVPTCGVHSGLGVCGAEDLPGRRGGQAARTRADRTHAGTRAHTHYPAAPPAQGPTWTGWV
jgi:hypothetical protein